MPRSLVASAAKNSAPEVCFIGYNQRNMVGCVICKKAVQPRVSNPYFPFCGPRCRQIDLGKWVNEEYRIASDSGASEEGEEPSDLTDADTETTQTVYDPHSHFSRSS